MKKRNDDIAKKYTGALSGKNNSIISATGNAKFANYANRNSGAIPPELWNTSFGCGDPVAFSAVEPGQAVLDLGCGTGLDLILSAEKVGSNGRVIGVDMTDEMLLKARRNISASGHKNIDVRKGLIESLPVQSNSIDWVISNCVINLSADKNRVFDEIFRVLKPGGKMLVSDIVADDLPFWIRHSGLLRAACAGGAISESKYLSGLASAGLHNGHILARQYYEPSQMASIVTDALPLHIANLSCCGKSITKSALMRAATPIAKKLWSARVYAEKPHSH